MGTRKKQKLARKKAKMDQIRKGRLTTIYKMLRCLSLLIRLHWTFPLEDGEREAGALLETKRKGTWSSGVKWTATRKALYLKELMTFMFLFHWRICEVCGGREAVKPIIWGNLIMTPQWLSGVIGEVSFRKCFQHSTRPHFFKTFWKFLTRSGVGESPGWAWEVKS